MSLPGPVAGLLPLDGFSGALIIFKEKELFYYSIVDENLVQKYTSPSALPESLGRRCGVIFSNCIDGAAILQLREDSVYAFTHLTTESTPNFKLLNLPKIPRIVPILSMVILNRTTDDWCLVTISGDDPINTDMSLYSIRKINSTVSMDKILKLPDSLLEVMTNVKPYYMCANMHAKSILFVGGDSESFSAISILPVSEITSTTSRRTHTGTYSHCQPLPNCEAVGLDDGKFLLTSAIGDLFSYSSGARKFDFIASDFPYSTLMLFSQQSKLIAIDTLYGDGQLIPNWRHTMKEREKIFRSLAPISCIESIDSQNTITCISRNSLSRIMTTGLGVHAISNDNLEMEKYSKIFFVFSKFVVCTNSNCTMIYEINESILHDGQQNVVLREQRISGRLPENLVGAFKFDSYILCVSENTVCVVNPADAFSVKETWRIPSGQRIVACAFLNGKLYMVPDIGGKIFVLTKSGCEELHVAHQEVSCLTVLDDRIITGHWDGSMTTTSGQKVWQSPSNAVPRSIAIAGTVCCIGYHDGHIDLLSTSSGGGGWTCISHITRGALVPEVIWSSKLGKFLVSGDSPCTISPDGRVTDIVDTHSGTVEPMSSITLFGDNKVLYLTVDGYLNCGWYGGGGDESFDFHVQREQECMHDYFKIAVTSISKTGRLVVGEVSITTPSSGDRISVYDEKNLKKLGTSFTLPPGDQLTCLASSVDGLLFVGTLGHVFAMSVSGDNELQRESSGYKVTVSADSDGSGSGPVQGLVSLSGNRVAVVAGRTLSLLKYDAGHHDFLHIASMEIDYLLTSIDAVAISDSHIRILVGDVSRSITVIDYRGFDEGLVIIGKDWESAQVSHVAILGYDKYIFSDIHGDVICAEILEPQTRRIERVCGVNIGDRITALEGRKTDTIWIGTSRGSLSVLRFEEQMVQLEDGGLHAFTTVMNPNRPNMTSLPLIRYIPRRVDTSR